MNQVAVVNTCIGIRKDGSRCPNPKTVGEICGVHHNQQKRKAAQNETHSQLVAQIITDTPGLSEEMERNRLKNLENDRLAEAFLLKIKDKVFSPREKNLLIVKRPDLIKEWDFIENEKVGINIETTPFRSHKAAYWRCRIDATRESYFISPDYMSTRNRDNCNCKECGIDLRRIHDKKILSAIRKTHQGDTTDTETGDKTEEFFAETLQETKKFLSVKVVGNEAGSGDIEIKTYDDKTYYIQSKTLTVRDANTESYCILNKKYETNILIVMVDKERKHFALEFSDNIKVTSLSLSFNYPRSPYKNMMYKEKEKFVSKLLEMIPLSSTGNEVSENTKKEIAMLIRLKKFCEERNWSFERNHTNKNTTDVFINGYRCQAKFRSQNVINSVVASVDSKKKAGKLNGKKISMPLQKGDCDFMIVEIGGTRDEPDSHLGNFLFIHETVLIDEKIITTDDFQGKLAFTVCLPNAKLNHWCKKYWNDETLISIPKAT